MTYNEIFYNSRVLLNNIPMDSPDVRLSSGLVSSVILLQVAYDSKINEFNNFMQESLKKLKREGFDERAAKVVKMRDIESRLKSYNEWKECDGCERPSRPTEDELEEAENIKLIEQEYEQECSDLDKAYTEIQAKKLNEEVSLFDKKLSRADYEELVSGIGVAGDIDLELNGQKSRIKKIEFLHLIAKNLVSL